MGEDERERRFLTDPFIVERTSIERLQTALDVLSDPSLTPLPRRLRAAFEGIRGRLETIKRELETRPQVVAAERAREERRGG